MKTGKILSIFTLIIAVAAGGGTTLFVMNSCDSSGGDDGGGAGADFDATQYYTKKDIDSMMPRHGGNETFGLTSANNSYATGLAVTIPQGYRYLLVQASGGDSTDSSDLCIGVSDADNYSNTLPPHNSYVTTSHLLFFNLESYQSGGVKIWTENLSASISAFTSLWIR